MRSFLVLLLVLSSPALAVRPGDTLYVKTKDTKVLKEPHLKAKDIVTLQPGKEVVWNGASVKDKAWHEVSVDGKKGFVHQSDLTPHALTTEIAATGKALSAQAFASSGATVVCSFGSTSRKYSGSSKEQEAQAELIYLEELNRERATGAVLDAKNRELHR